MACLEENDVLELLEGAQQSAFAIAAREHVWACERCRSLVATVARVVVPDAVPEAAGWVDAADILRPGTSLGHYAIERLVGQGGMGIVYAARDTRLERKVALKILRPEAADQIERLRQEAATVASLSHPNIVEVYDVRESDYGAFVAMEYVEGEDLSQWLAQPRPIAERLEVLVQAGNGLAAAHRAGIVHRDFKPQNVLIGRDGRARVVDFGLAVSIRGADPQHGGAIVGTPAYLAPEQVRGGPVGAEVDQFAFCVVAFEALVGRRPFPGRDLAEVLASIENGKVAPSHGIGRRVRSAILRGLAANPADRFGSMPELLLALGRPPRRWPIAAFAAAVLGVSAWWGLSRDATPPPDSVARAVATDPALRQRVDRLYDEVSASQVEGAWPGASADFFARAGALLEQAEARADARAEAKARLLVGTMQMWELRHDDAQFSFEAGFIAARRAEDHDIAFETARMMMQLAVFVRADKSLLERWSLAAAREAEATEDPHIWARLRIFEGRIASAQGDLVRAIDKYDEAEAYLADQASVLTWEELLAERGMAKIQSGQPEAGLEDLERSLARFDAAYPRDTMDIAPTLNALGVAQRALGRFDEAAKTFERLKRMIPQVPGNPDLAAVRGNLAQIYADTGRYEEALAEFRAVRKAFEAFAGPKHADASRTSAAIASALYQLGRYEEAEREAQEALRWEVPAALRNQVRLILASARVELGDPSAAKRTLEEILSDTDATDNDRTEAEAVLRRLASR